MNHDRARDTVLVCVHGLACSADDWAGLEAATGTWSETVALSLPGHDGTPPAGITTIVAMADWVNARREQLGSRRQILVGHSMGARIVLEAAARASEATSGIVLIDSSLQAEGPVDAVLRARRSLSAADRAARKATLFGGMLCGCPMADFRAVVMNRLSGIDPATLEALSDSIAVWDAASAADRLGKGSLPLLVLQSTTAEGGAARRPIEPGEDTRWTALVRDRAESRARIVNLSDLGHFPHVEAPEVVAEAIAEVFASVHITP